MFGLHRIEEPSTYYIRRHPFDNVSVRLHEWANPLNNSKHANARKARAKARKVKRRNRNIRK